MVKFGKFGGHGLNVDTDPRMKYGFPTVYRIRPSMICRFLPDFDINIIFVIQFGKCGGYGHNVDVRHKSS